MTEAIILAGGLGTRLRSVVQEVPKPMAPVKGKPFLEHLMAYWRKQGVSRFVLAVCHKAEIIEGHFGNKFQGAEISYSIEASPLGTGGAVLQAREKLKSDDPFLVVNGDTFFELSLSRMCEFHRSQKADITIGLAKVAKNTRYSGLDLASDGRLHSFQAQGKSQHTWINGGVYLCESRDWGSVRTVSLEAELFQGLMDQGKRVYGFPSEGRFIDIGIPSDYAASAEVLST